MFTSCDHRIDVPCCHVMQPLPEFGPYLNEKEGKIAAYKKSIDPATEFQPEVHRPAYKPSTEVPAIKVCCCLFLLLLL